MLSVKVYREALIDRAVVILREMSNACCQESQGNISKYGLLKCLCSILSLNGPGLIDQASLYHDLVAIKDDRNLNLNEVFN